MGNAGNDLIVDGAGADLIYGGTANDRILGGNGANPVYLGSGDDRFIAGLGTDVVTGGPGADVFVFQSAAQIGVGAARDVITDFGARDKIDLSAMNTQFNGSAGLLGGGTSSFYHFAATGLLIGDADGNGVVYWVLELNGPPAIGASDFIL